MPRDSSGNYTRAVSPYVNGTIANATTVNSEMDDFATEVTDSLTASGKKAWGANQNGGGFWINTLGNTRVYTTTGSANAYIITTGAALTNLAGRLILFKASFTNTGAATMNVDGIGAIDLRKNGTTALASGDVVNGNCYAALYDGTVLQIIGLFSGVFQPLDATLTALAALSTAANQYILATGTDTFSMASVTANAQSLLADSSVPRLGVAGTWTAAQTFPSNTQVSAASTPQFFIRETGAATDQKIWAIGRSSAGQFRILTLTDAEGFGNIAIAISRTGTTIDEIELNATLFDLNGTLDVSGSIELGHVSDTTLARIAAGRAGIEGVEIATASNTLTLTNKTLTTPTINGGALSGAVTLVDEAPTSNLSVGYRGAPVVSGNSAYAFPAADAGKTVYHDEAGTRTWTIPANASVAHPIGTVFILDNTGNSGAAGAITLAITTDTLRRGDGTAGTGSRTIPASGVACIRKVAATIWIITGTFS